MKTPALEITPAPCWAIVRTQKNGHECVPLYFPDRELAAKAFIGMRGTPEATLLELRATYGRRETLATWMGNLYYCDNCRDTGKVGASECTDC